MRYLFILLLLLIPHHAFATGTLVHESEHFGIFVNSPDADYGERASRILEDAVEEWSERLPFGQPTVTVEIADSDQWFYNSAGNIASPDVNGVAIASQNKIVVKSPSLTPLGTDFPGTLRHELVHILLDRNTNTDRMPRWLNEGICMMLANEFKWQSSFSVAQMFFEGRVIEYRVLDSALSAPESGMQFGDAYAQSLSMTRELMDQIGEEKFWQVVMALKEMSFGDALRQYAGIEPLDFWDAYRRSLWTLAFWGAITPSSVLGLGAFLVIIVYFIKRRSNKVIEKRWEREDFEDALYGRDLTTWDELVEDPDAWKRGTKE